MKLKRFVFCSICLICVFVNGCGVAASEMREETYVSIPVPMVQSLDQEYDTSDESVNKAECDKNLENDDVSLAENAETENKSVMSSDEKIKEKSVALEELDSHIICDPQNESEEESAEIENIVESEHENEEVKTQESEEAVCNHKWVQEYEEYEIVKEFVWACNGCGYPLFTRNGSGVVCFDEMYLHPAYQTENGSECTGGAWHSEMYYKGFCGVCGESVEFRQCAFGMGNVCVHNYSAGSGTVKAESGEHYLYYQSCNCGKNILLAGADGKYLKAAGETCEYCKEVR